jgi:hypothetical protein
LIVDLKKDPGSTVPRQATIAMLNADGSNIASINDTIPTSGTRTQVDQDIALTTTVSTVRLTAGRGFSCSGSCP